MNSVQVNDYCILQGHPCQIKQTTKTIPGRRGIGEVNIVCIDVLTGSRIQYCQHTNYQLQIPIVQVNEYEVADISQDNFVSIILDDGSLRQDLKLPKDKQQANKLMNLFNQNQTNHIVYFKVVKIYEQEYIVSGRIQKCK